MSEYPLTDADISAFKEQLLASIPPGSSVGNGWLRRKLEWDDDRYWYIRNLLVQAGSLSIGRGKGGSVQHVVPVEEMEVGRVSNIAESDLYEPILETLRSDWVPDHQIQDFIIHKTAHQGRRDTGGKWTRPDITLASSNTYTYVPGRSVEVRTFEVKTWAGLDVTAVYEALAHRRAAHYAYVLVHVPDAQRAALEPMLERLIGDAQEHGVGFVTIGNAASYDTWDFEVDARRANPNPADLDAFIRTQTSDAFREKIVSWCRNV
jgi:hypothetical protein